MKRASLRCPKLVAIVAVLALPLGAMPAANSALPRDGAVGASIAVAVRAEVAQQGSASVWVVLRSDADLSGATKQKTEAGKAAFVRSTEMGHAATTQAGLRALLDQEGAEYRSFWITNALLVTADAQLLEQIAARPEVERIEPDRPVALTEPTPGTSEARVHGVEWNVDEVNAPRVWDELGVRGEDIVVASIDTGVQFDHPALVRQYRGNKGGGTFDHNYSWFDPARVCLGKEPCDNVDHGTHVTGTMIGDDGAANQIGVAPDATWIAAKGCESSSCSESSLLAAGQWIIAPTDLNGQNPRPDLAPDVVNNSWGGAGGAFWYEDVVEAWVAAGIFPSFSGGNAGPGCVTVTSPGDYPSSYSSAAYDINRTIAGFSSRGAGPNGEIKPNIAAPGVNVRSSVPGGGYASFNGTSMAAPHTSATVALIWSASLELRGDVAATRELLDQTAIDTPNDQCGGTAADNNVWGEGRLDALAAVDQAPRGDEGAAAGRVSADGEPAAGATVTYDGQMRRTRTTSEDGTYTFPRLQVGDYAVTVEKYGYLTATRTVSVAEDQTTTADFALQAAPTSTLHGTITDGSGHGWPLHAKVTIDEHPGGPVYTDPYTGRYSVELPQDTYTMQVDPLYPGYATTDATVTVDDPDVQRDVTVGANCDAPGYTFRPAGPGTDFTGWTGTTPQSGWANVDNLGTGLVWHFDNPGNRQARPGDDADFAILDSDRYGPHANDAALVSPVTDLSGATDPEVRFDTSYRPFIASIADVDVSIDGGQTWATVWSKTGTHVQGGVAIPIPQAAGQSSVRVRFRYRGLFDWWWALDNVAIGNCELVQGGLVAGTVTDANTGEALDRAKIASEARPDESGVSASSEDPSRPHGSYWLFSSLVGDTGFTAEGVAHETTSARVDVVRDGVVRKDWALNAGVLEVAPSGVSATQTLGRSVKRAVTFTNDGSAALHVTLGLQNGGYTSLAKGVGSSTLPPPRGVGQPPATPPGSEWKTIADYPLKVWGHVVATDPQSGAVYAVGGLVDADRPEATTEAYVYSPSTNSWSPIAPAPKGVAFANAAFLNGSLYLVGGVTASGAISDTVYTYNPGADRWSEAVDLPQPVAAAGAAVLDGKLYVVGGCTRFELPLYFRCAFAPDEPRLDSVYRFDPRAKTWTELADYPTPVARQACGGINGELVCTGGYEPLRLNDTYIYDPGTDTWSQGADLPARTNDMAYAAANGKLQIVGGNRYIDPFEGGTDVVWEYDPLTDAWSALPRSTYRASWAGGGCGLYHLGGYLAVLGPEAGPKSNAEVLPGYDRCDDSAATPWLSVEKTSFDVPAGTSVTVVVTLDAAHVQQPGTYTATLYAATNSPDPVQAVPVTMKVDPPRSWSLVKGTVTNSAGQPLRGATIVGARERSSQNSFEVKSNAEGYYQWWLSNERGSLQVSVAKDGYQPRARTVSRPTTVNFALKAAPPGTPVRQTQSAEAVAADTFGAASVLTGGAVAGGKHPSQKAATKESASPSAAKIAGEVRAEVAKKGSASFWVVLDSEADLSAAEKLKTEPARAAFVRRVEMAHADKTQAGLRALLALEEAEFRSFWISNVLLVTGDAQLLEKVAARPEVERIEPDTPLALPKPDPSTEEARVNGVEWNIDRINAPQVWNQLGVRGEEIVVASIDSGVQFDHPALVGQYRGNNGDGTFDHDYSWFDPARVCLGKEPCDNVNHGTHVTGTMVGDDEAANQIGVAPGAKWIAAKGCETNTCSFASLLAAGQWIIAPTDLNGKNPRPELAPDVVNNSWGGAGGDFFYQQVVDSWVAAGIFPSFAGGNTGSACETATSPGDYLSTYSTGSFNRNNVIAGTSARGPGEHGETKPNIAAPGVQIRSSVPGGGYASFNGTSMAAPHTSATVALIWSASLSLRGDVAATRELLDRTAIDMSNPQCGGTAADNNVWGEGRLNALAAVDQAPRGDEGSAAGHVSFDGAPIAGATIVYDGPVRRTRTTGADGSYSFPRLLAGDYTVTVKKYGYVNATRSVTVVKDTTVTADFALEEAPPGVLHGTVADGSGHGWPVHARISIEGYPGNPIYSDPYTGRYSVELPQNAYAMQVEPLYPGYESKDLTVDLDTDDRRQDITVEVNNQLPCLAPGYGHHGIVQEFAWPVGFSAHDGWTVVPAHDNTTTYGWVFADSGNDVPGGAGGFAIVIPAFHAGATDTTLLSPVVDLTHSSAPRIAFDLRYASLVGTSAAAVDLSLDGGQTWRNVWLKSGAAFDEGHVDTPIPEAAGEPDARVRLRYAGQGAASWAVDNVIVGTRACEPTPGGLVAGVVTDANTGEPLNDAEVASHARPGELGMSAASDDPNVSDGFYLLFSSLTGSTRLTATAAGYPAASAAVDVVVDGLARKDWPLKAGRLKVTPGTVSSTSTLGSSATRDVRLTNDGSAPLHLTLGTQSGTFAPVGAAENQATHGSPSAGSGHEVRSADPTATAAPAGGATGGSRWTEIAPYPTPIAGNAVAYDARTGIVYSVGGGSQPFATGERVTAKGYAYSKTTDTWSPIADAPRPLQHAAAAFVNGTLYVVGGLNDANEQVSTAYAYDPAIDRWTQVASLPGPRWGAGQAVLGGMLYLVGGCTEDPCWVASNSVLRYDPLADTWAEVADYPTTVLDQACAGIDTKVVCAGGMTDALNGEWNGQLSATYVYDAASDTWSQGADMPYDAFEMGYGAANGRLQVFGGRGGSMLSNLLQNRSDAAEYDLATNTWSRLPSLPAARVYFQTGGSCGLYAIGGGTEGWGNFGTTDAWTLPGYSRCNGSGEPAWLSASKTSVALNPGQSVTVKVKLDSAKVAQPGSYTATLWARSDAPYAVKPVTVTMHVKAPKGWNLLSGAVTDAGGEPIRGATVQIETDCSSSGHCGSDTYTVSTNPNGRYQWWLSGKDDPLRVIAAKDLYLQQIKRPKSTRAALDFSLLAFPQPTSDDGEDDHDDDDDNDDDDDD
jgi:subtilisin family serine protease/N-acetylneuraminic acid mutarotase